MQDGLSLLSPRSVRAPACFSLHARGWHSSFCKKERSLARERLLLLSAYSAVRSSGACITMSGSLLAVLWRSALMMSDGEREENREERGS